jgi:hypothetical protein
MIGHIDRHADALGDPLGFGVAAQIAGGDEHRGCRPEIGNRCLLDRAHVRTGRPCQRHAPLGGRTLAHHHDLAAGKIEEERKMLHESRPRRGSLAAAR